MPARLPHVEHTEYYTILHYIQYDSVSHYIPLAVEAAHRNISHIVCFVTIALCSIMAFQLCFILTVAFTRDVFSSISNLLVVWFVGIEECQVAHVLKTHNNQGSKKRNTQLPALATCAWEPRSCRVSVTSTKVSFDI